MIRVPNMQTKIKAQQLGLGVGYIPKHLILDALAGKLSGLPCGNAAPTPSCVYGVA